jgi:prophage regulatory protein
MQTNTSTATAQQFQTALIRRKEVEKLTALSRSRIYDLMKIGKFPRPVQLGAMSVAWLEVEIHEWIADRIADRSAAAGGVK